MKRSAIRLSMLALGFAPCLAAAVETGLGKYQVILDRAPFGEALVLDVAAPPTQTISLEQSFAKTLKMTAIIEMDDGEKKIGLIDTADNETFYLREGDIAPSGIELVTVYYDEEKALIRKSEEMVEISLDSGVFTPLTPAEQKTRLEERSRLHTSYAERRRARQERRKQEALKPPPQPKYAGQELQKHLEEYQMEVIRQGLPPLPIPLTPEMDDKLVAEGVLPPVE